jgi:hypothetical protein
MQGLERARIPADESRQNGKRREDTLASDQHEPFALSHSDVLNGWSVSRMLGLGCGADEPALKEKVDARLQMCQVRHGHKQLAARHQDPLQLCQSLRLLFER